VFLADNFDRAIFTPDGDERIAFGTRIWISIEFVLVYVSRRHLV
jgi:hypothetical protein